MSVLLLLWALIDSSGCSMFMKLVKKSMHRPDMQLYIHVISIWARLLKGGADFMDISHRLYMNLPNFSMKDIAMICQGLLVGFH